MAFFYWGIFHPPNPQEHFFEACKPRKPTAPPKLTSFKKTLILLFSTEKPQLKKKKYW
jgi:hypothetical protein